MQILYKILYKINIEDSSFLGIGDKLPKLSGNENNKLETYITEEQLKEVIKRSQWIL